MLDKRFVIFATKGLITWVPPLHRFAKSRRRAGGTGSAEYCLHVWVAHLTALSRLGGLGRVPDKLVEFGPGDSLGVGLAFLLMGGRRYHAVDYMPYADTRTNVGIIGELVSLLQGPNAMPDEPPAESVVTRKSLAEALKRSRVSDITRSVLSNDGRWLQYTVTGPGKVSAEVAQGSADIVVSNAVMEHVQDPSTLYRCAYLALKPGGLASHVVDHRSHGTSDWWNGHWQYGKLLWQLACGKRPYVLNRLPSSRHVVSMEGAGFEIVSVQRTPGDSGLPVSRFASTFRDMQALDAMTAVTHVVAQRPWA